MMNAHQASCFLITALLLLAGCGEARQPSVQEQRASLIRIDLDKSNPEKLLRYYFGSYGTPEPQDPFVAGVVRTIEGTHFLDLDAFEKWVPWGRAELEASAKDGLLEWDELAAFWQKTYYRARSFPDDLSLFRASLAVEEDPTTWFETKVVGVMSTHLRRISVSRDALKRALRSYRENERRLLYPIGTTFIGGQYEERLLVETTIMQKRADGFWDFFIYGPDGRLIEQTSAAPRALKAPTQCVGCHFGAKVFEPEKSFPGVAPPGPNGPRAIMVAEDLRRSDIVRYFDEHRLRSDGVLGLYGTLFTSDLLHRAEAGLLSPEEREILDLLEVK